MSDKDKSDVGLSGRPCVGPRTAVAAPDRSLRRTEEDLAVGPVTDRITQPARSWTRHPQPKDRAAAGCARDCAVRPRTAAAPAHAVRGAGSAAVPARSLAAALAA